MRVEEQYSALEQYLGRPGEGYKCLAYFQLKALWRAATKRLGQFASDLARQCCRIVEPAPDHPLTLHDILRRAAFH